MKKIQATYRMAEDIQITYSKGVMAENKELKKPPDESERGE